jgi:hypothetical protein
MNNDIIINYYESDFLNQFAFLPFKHTQKSLILQKEVAIEEESYHVLLLCQLQLAYKTLQENLLV